MLISLPNYSKAQEWSREQKEVLQATEKFIEFWANRDLENYINCLHDEFTGWFGTDLLPMEKQTLRKWETYNFKKSKILVHDIQPVSIKVSGDVALISYYLNKVRENDEGEKIRHSKWTDVLKKENGKWLQIGTHGGNISED